MRTTWQCSTSPVLGSPFELLDFSDRLLERLIAKHEASEIPQYYVPLSCYREKGEVRETELTRGVFKLMTDFIDTWLGEEGRNHISILGDFGMGKTWFCQRYAYKQAKRYLADPTARIPILITLRDYSRAYDIEQLVTDALVNRYGVQLGAGYKTFERLNAEGRLLLIFDGFDEMERRVSDYRTTVNNFWELAKVVGSKSKILLTCRTAYFKHRKEEREVLEPRHGEVSVVSGRKVIDLRGREQYEVVHLLKFTDEDIKVALQKRLPTSWKPVYEKIMSLPNLRDLSSRPVLLDMIVKTLPQIEDAGQINQATLYEAYIDELLKRRWSKDTDYIPPQDRLFFVQELAWEMHTSQRLNIPFSEFPERVTTHFGLKDDPERAAFFERDIRTQSYLVRDDVGNYRFGHKSFMEYFVARKMADAISGPAFDVEKAIEVWKQQPLTLEVRSFLSPMVADPTRLWQLIEVTKGRTVAEVGYAGGKAVTLLKLLGESLKGVDFAETVLIRADLTNSDCTGTNFSGATLHRVALRNAKLRNANFSDADFGESGLGIFFDTEVLPSMTFEDDELFDFGYGFEEEVGEELDVMKPRSIEGMRITGARGLNRRYENKTTREHLIALGAIE